LELRRFVVDTECRTLSVPAAGKLFYDLGRDGSYEAAKRGELIVIKVGRQKRVPIKAMERKMEEEAVSKG
jgi:hypothetical protein